MSLRSTPILVVVIAAVASSCVALGLWQMDRLKERRAANAEALARRSLPAVIITGREEGGGLTLDNRWVIATGTFDYSHLMIIRGRVYREAPGVHVVAPLRLRDSDTAVLVNLGFVPAADGMTVDRGSFVGRGVGADGGPRRITGMAFSIPATADTGGGGRAVRNGITTWRRLDLAALRRTLPYPILDVYVLEAPGGDRKAPDPARRLTPRPIDNGPHLSYAIQWFSFATIAIVGGVALIRQERKRGTATGPPPPPPPLPGPRR